MHLGHLSITELATLCKWWLCSPIFPPRERAHLLTGIFSHRPPSPAPCHGQKSSQNASLKTILLCLHSAGEIQSKSLQIYRQTGPCVIRSLIWVQPHHPSLSNSKESACNAGDLGSIPGSGRSPGVGSGSPLQYSCLENPMDRGAWWATVHGSQRVGHD